MIALFSDSEFIEASSRHKLPLQCLTCGSIFYRAKNDIQGALGAGRTKNFCSNKCSKKHKDKGHVIYIQCDQCDKQIQKFLSQMRKHKHHFCSSSCAAKYHNSHKQSGTRRSKLESWLETQLVTLYPSLEFHFNRTDAIDAELDIYIPSLKLAFELNGIFHYEPIYGPVVFNRMQTNDHRKILACAERGVELCIIDVSKVSYFKERSARPYLEIIQRIVDQAIGRESSLTLMSDAT